MESLRFWLDLEGSGNVARVRVFLRRVPLVEAGHMVVLEVLLLGLEKKEGLEWVCRGGGCHG